MRGSVLLVGVEQPKRVELEQRLWALGGEVRWIDSVSVEAEFRSDPPGVVLVSGDPEPVQVALSAVARPIPMLDAGESDPATLVEQVCGYLPPAREVVLGGCRVSLDEGLAHWEDRSVSLTRTEIALLRFLLAHSERVVPGEELLRKVWGYRPGVQTRTVTTTVYRLRKKIEEDPRRARFLLTRYGQGFQLIVEREDASVGRSGNLVVAPMLRGRVADQERVRALLARHGLVTVIGPAGVGKTSLCRSVAVEMEAPEAWFCDLTSASTESEVVEVVIRTLGLVLPEADRDTSGRALAARGAVVLVLDNCEGVVESLAELGDAVRASCGGGWGATSFPVVPQARV